MYNTHTTASLQPGQVVADFSNAGAVLYGPFSFSVSGTLHLFINWLNQKSHPYGRILSKWNPGSREFSAAWLYLGSNDPEGFLELQEVFYISTESLAS